MNTTLLKLASYYSDGDREYARFNLAEALYWFAANYHDGMHSRLYRHLSTTRYRPSPIGTGPEPGSAAAEIYRELIAR